MSFEFWEHNLPQTRLWGHREAIGHFGLTLCGSKQRVTLCAQRNLTSIVHSCESHCNGIKQVPRGPGSRRPRRRAPSVGPSVLCHPLGHGHCPVWILSGAGAVQQLFVIPQGHGCLSRWEKMRAGRAHQLRVMPQRHRGFCSPRT